MASPHDSGCHILWKSSVLNGLAMGTQVVGAIMRDGGAALGSLGAQEDPGLRPPPPGFKISGKPTALLFDFGGLSGSHETLGPSAPGSHCGQIMCNNRLQPGPSKTTVNKGGQGASSPVTSAAYAS